MWGVGAGVQIECGYYLSDSSHYCPTHDEVNEHHHELRSSAYCDD